MCNASLTGLTGRTTVAWVAVAVTAFHLAYIHPWAAPLSVVYIFALVKLAHGSTWRHAFYPGLAVGFLIALGRLDFFWRIFSGGALALWLVFAFWIGLFCAIARLALRRFPQPWAWVLLPFLWTGLEYFRSELYPLRFTWLNPGLAFDDAAWSGLTATLGNYGIGFLVASLAAAAAAQTAVPAGAWRLRSTLAALCAGIALLALPRLAPPVPAPAGTPLPVAGVQMEFPTEKEVLIRLNEVVRQQPEARLIVLSEYSFQGPVPDNVREWCRKHGRYLVAGGTAPAGQTFRNTAFVISPHGQVVFEQVKSVPIQFMKDGLPASEQRVWESPWGRIGIVICYDLSYTRVTDHLVRLGAQAILAPTMDVIDWGSRQHQLHGRIAPVRAAEYGLPIFRIASSGVSQTVTATGQVAGSAPCPGEGVILAGKLNLGPSGRLPADRWLAPACTAFAAALTALFFVQTARNHRPAAATAARPALAGRPA